MSEQSVDVTVPALVLRALAGKWAPSARHKRMATEDLAVAMNCTPWVAGRAMLACRALELARRGRAEDLAGKANGQPERRLDGADMLAEASRLTLAALEPEPDVVPTVNESLRETIDSVSP